MSWRQGRWQKSYSVPSSWRCPGRRGAGGRGSGRWNWAGRSPGRVLEWSGNSVESENQGRPSAGTSLAARQRAGSIVTPRTDEETASKCRFRGPQIPVSSRLLPDPPTQVLLPPWTHCPSGQAALRPPSLPPSLPSSPRGQSRQLDLAALPWNAGLQLLALPRAPVRGAAG